jgi:hypothetical protein
MQKQQAQSQSRAGMKYLNIHIVLEQIDWNAEVPTRVPWRLLAGSN